MRAKLSALEVILANGSDEDRDNLENVLEGTHWAVVDAERPEIENVVRESASPIVICAGDHSDCWRTTIRSLRKARRNVCVLVVSSDSNAISRDQVVRCGGFDVLTRPFDRNQILPMLIFAYAYCRGHGPFLSRRARHAYSFPESSSSLAPTAASR
jgi:DNA-binding response OmpR family regulator